MAAVNIAPDELMKEDKGGEWESEKEEGEEALSSTKELAPAYK